MQRIRFIILSVIYFFFIVSAKAANFKDESLDYVISYKWGIIHKDAGDAVLKLQNKGDKYMISLYGKTKPWADKFYQVRDTLLCTMEKHGLKPLSYSKIAHEDGKYSRDDISYIYKGEQVLGNATLTREKKKEVTVKEKHFEAMGPTFDMLSVFYYLRTLDYDKLMKGEKMTATIFSGTQVEKLTVRCEGKEMLKLRDKSEREAYHIKFSFTRDGQKKSSDDINALISTDEAHIPLQLVGSLPVGQVRCYYIPKK